MNRFLQATAGIVFLVLLGSCGVGLPLEITAPANVSASTTEVEQIRVTWDAVPGADRYFVYRSRSASGPFGEQGPFGTIPYATVTDTTFVDDALDPLTFYYRVSAFDDVGNRESDQSETAAGLSLSGPLEWQSQQLVFGGFRTARLAVDRFGDVIRAYVLSVSDSADVGVSVRRITNTGSLELLDTAFGDVDGTDARVADLAVIDGTVWAALVSEVDDSVELWSYTDAAGTFTRRVAGLPQAHPSAPLLSLVAYDAETLWLAYRSSAENAVVREIATTGPVASVITPPADVGSGIGTNTIAGLELQAGNGGLVLFYETYDPITNNATDTVGAEWWNGTGWSAGSVDQPGADVVSQAYAVDATASGAVDARAYVAYSVGASPYTLDALDGTPVPDAPSANLTDSPDFTEESLALAADDGDLYLFYEGTVAGGGVIDLSTDGGANWTGFSPTDFAQDDDPLVYELVAYSGKVYAAWIGSGGLLSVRAYQ
jgi:hypothetical protein